MVPSASNQARLTAKGDGASCIANQIRVVDEIIHSGQLIKRRGEKVTKSAEKLREMLEREVEVFAGAHEGPTEGLRVSDGDRPNTLRSLAEFSRGIENRTVRSRCHAFCQLRCDRAKVTLPGMSPPTTEGT
jgi:hypothetical protein